MIQKSLYSGKSATPETPLEKGTVPISQPSHYLNRLYLKYLSVFGIADNGVTLDENRPPRVEYCLASIINSMPIG